MSIPDGAGQYVISGVCEDVETFAFGYWVNDSTDIGGSDLDENVNWVTFRDHLLGGMSPDQSITRYTYRRYEGGVIVRQEQTDVSHPGTGTGGNIPLQVACVMTLRTATLSRRGRGRIYLPTCGASMMAGDSHLFGTTRVNQMVDSLAAYFTGQAGASIPPVVMSRTASAMHPITSVDADYVPDTQRRRRNQLSTTRHSAAV